MASENNNNVAHKPVYVHQIPYSERKQLCRILDYKDAWKDLAGIHMKYSVLKILDIDHHCRKCEASPTDKLLKDWGEQNHEVSELFVLLARLEHVTAMTAIKHLVEKKYHKLIEVISPDETTTQNNVPLHVHYIEQGRKIESSRSKILNGPPYEESLTSNSPSPSPQSKPEESKPESAASDSRVAECAGALLMIPYPELAQATANWESSRILGKGGFGIVYKGDWKHTAVAIKRLKSATGSGGVFTESLRELKYLNAFRHDNVLPLYGYSIGGEAPCLVYQLMSGGSLEDRLKCRHGQTPLPWKQRLRISQGVAKGLQYLHTAMKHSKMQLIHGDIKSANILLDTCGEPKIGDFGLAREGPSADEFTHMKVSRVHGTRPYLPDEFLRGHRLSTKVDVYSFGVVLFELVTGLPAHDIRREMPLLKDHVVQYCREHPTDISLLQDPRLLEVNDNDPDLCKKLITVGVRCVQARPLDRPEMVVIWEHLISLGDVPEPTFPMP